MANVLLAIGFAGDDRFDAFGLEEGAEGIGVITFVGAKLRHAWDQADASFRQHTIGDVASRQRNASPLYSVDMPLARNALERAVATVCEAQSRAGDQILYVLDTNTSCAPASAATRAPM